MLTIYKASAGSGKTYTLTLEYIKLLLGTKNREDGTYSLNKRSDKPQKFILAVTFTNKATEEMKKRIVKELSILSANPTKSQYWNELTKFFNVYDANKISESAKEALYSILFNFSWFNVSTIDSFFQLVLRTFAHEIDRSGSFEIELDRKYIIAQAIHALFASLGNESTIEDKRRSEILIHWLKRYMNDNIQDGKSFNIFNRQESLFSDLVSDMDKLMDETFSINSDQIKNYLSDSSRLKAFEKALFVKLEQLYTALATKAKQVLDMFETNEDLVPFSWVKKDWLIERIEKKAGKEIGANMKKGIADKRAFFKNRSKIDGVYKSCPPIPENLLDVMQTLVSEYNESLPEIIRLNILYRYLFQLGMLGLVSEAMTNFCKENNSILLSDTNELLSKIIGKSNSPFIYERLGVRLHNYLIDEFQDTSRMQWQNLTPLVHESLGYNNDNLIIGDEKQSIYRFRNAAPELLGNEVADGIKDRFSRDTLKERGLTIEENKNWRSTCEVVKFNNSLFYSLGANDIFPERNAYGNVIQEIPDAHQNFHGNVEITFLDKSKNEDFTNAATALAIERISELLKTFKPSEIAILIRYNNEAQIIINALLEAMKPQEDGTPGQLPRFDIISKDALTINSSPIIKLIISILRLISLPESVEKNDDNEKKSHYGKTKRELVRILHRFELFHHSEKDSGKALLRALYDENESQSLLKLALNAKCTDLNSVVEQIIITLPDTIVNESTVFLTAFQDIVRDYCARNTNDVYSFLRWWDAHSGSFKLDTPQTSNALTVTTIHKSKGIEYPCVVIPYWGMKPKPEDEVMWLETGNIEGIPDEIIPPFIAVKQTSALELTPYKNAYSELKKRQNIDKLNVAYVAFTRAVNNLTVIAMGSGENVAKVSKDAIEAMTPEFVESLSARIEKKAFDSIISLSDKLTEQENGDLVFRYGTVVEPVRNKVKATLDENRVDEKSLLMPSYRAFDNSSVLKIAKLEKDEDFDAENARIKGTFMHDVLSTVRCIEDLEYSCMHRANKIGLSKEIASKRFKELKNAIEIPEAIYWFKDCKRVIMERTISKDQTHKRPDRIVWTADGHIDVIDYKFGSFSDNDESYNKQVSDYVVLLRSAGYKNVRGFLWYPLDKKIITVDDGLFPTLF